MTKAMFDMDGVLAEFTLPFRRLAWYHDPQTQLRGHRDSETWDFEDIPAGINAAVWKEIERSDDFWYGLPALVTETELARLADLTRNESVIFVTARVGRNAGLQTEAWLEDRGIKNPHVIVSPRKGDIAGALQVQFAIDDKAGNAIYTAYHSLPTRSYLIDRPYNRFDPKVLGSKVKRVSTVSEFLTDVERRR